MAPKSEKYNEMKELQQKELELFEERNTKYGDSFSKTFEDYGNPAILSQLDHKMNRIKNILTNGLEEGTESVLDNLMDLAIYANLSILILSKKKTKKVKPAAAKPKKARKPKNTVEGEPKPKAEDKPQEETKPEKDEGPFSGCSKEDLIKVAKELGAEVPKKANRAKLIAIISTYKKSKVAVAMTVVKPANANEAAGDTANEKAEA